MGSVRFVPVWWALAAALVLGALPPLLVGGHAPVWAQTTGLQVDGEITYRLEPGDATVRVTVQLTLTNTMPSRTRGALVETPYFGSFAIPAVGPVVGASARSSSGRDLPVTVRSEDDLLHVVDVDLIPNLVHGSPQTVTVNFELPGQPSRSEQITRVNEAFAVWALLAPDPALEMVVDVPEDFDVTFGRDVADAISQRDARRIYRLPAVGDPDAPAVFVTARNDAAFDTRKATVADRQVTVEAWPDDEEWAEFAVDTVERGLPALQEVLGLELPDRALTVVESTGGYHLGYAGVYIADLNLIEVGDELDRQVMLHELSHLWVNPNLFAERWIFEGLAEEVSNRAAEALGETRTPPDPIDPDDPAAVALNDWGDPSVLDPDRHAGERYAYNAAYAVVQDLAEEIGPEAFREVIAAAHDRDLAYARPGGPAERTQISDWRYFYDLLDLVGGSERARDIFAQHVVNEQQLARLDQRDIALEALHGLEETADGWTAPLAVRQEISRWRFETAHRLIDRASELTARVDGLADSMAEVDIDPHGPIRDVYETADDLDDLDRRVERFEQVGRDLLAVHRRRDDAGPLQRLGLIGTGDTLAAAHDRYRNGQLDRTAELVTRASHTTDRATRRGAALLVAATLLGVATTAHLRNRRG